METRRVCTRILYPRNDTRMQQHFRFCGKLVEFRLKRRKFLTETKEISGLLNDDETKEFSQI